MSYIERECVVEMKEGERKGLHIFNIVLICLLFTSCITLIIIIRYPFHDVLAHNINANCTVINCSADYPVHCGKSHCTEFQLDYSLERNGLIHTRNGFIHLGGEVMDGCNEMPEIECYYDNRDINGTLSLGLGDHTWVSIILLSYFIAWTFCTIMFIQLGLLFGCLRIHDDNDQSEEEEEEEEEEIAGSAFVTIQ